MGSSLRIQGKVLSDWRVGVWGRQAWVTEGKLKRTNQTAGGGIWWYPVLPTWGGSVPIQQVVVLGGVEVHDDAGSIQQLLVAAGAGDAVVAVPAVTSVVQLLRLHLATRRCPG